MQDMIRRIIGTTVALLAAASCADSAEVSEEFDPDKADRTEAIPFFGEKKDLTMTGGVSAARYNLSSEASAVVGDLEEHTSFGCYNGIGAKLAPADLKAIVADRDRLLSLINHLSLVNGSGMGDAIDPEIMKLQDVARGSLFTNIYEVDAESATLEDWPKSERDAYKSGIRIIVRSMLSSPTAKAVRFTYSPDWTDETWAAVDAETGEVKLVMHGGDC